MTEPGQDAPDGALWPFLAIAFGLAWGMIALILLAPGPVVALFGPITGRHPLFLLAVYSPAIAAVALVLRAGGPGGLRRFLGRLLLWRAPLGWWAAVLFGVPLVYLAAAAFAGEGATWPRFGSLGAALGAIALAAAIGPVEELGWRGFALPILQRRMSPLAAGLTLGLVWGVWHLPAFLLSGTPQSDWPFVPFLVGAVAVTVILTALFNAARGSLLLPALAHWQLNNPLWPDTQPWDAPLFAAAAVLVALLCSRTSLAPEAAVVTVIPEPRPRRGGS